MIYHWLFGALLAATVMVMTACAGGGGATEVQVTLTDFKVESAITTFSAGTPYRFVVHNKGGVSHEFMIMPPGVMIMPSGEMDHSKALVDVHEDRLPVGAKTTQEFTFTQPGTYEFACHLPGHYEAGMKQQITVQ